MYKFLYQRGVLRVFTAVLAGVCLCIPPVFAEETQTELAYTAVESVNFSSYDSVGEVPLLALQSDGYTTAVRAGSALRVKQLASQQLNDAGTACNTAGSQVFTKTFERPYDGTYLFSIRYRANVEELEDVVTESGTVSMMRPYYTVTLLGNLSLRIYNDCVVVTNTASVTDSTMSVSTLNGNANAENTLYVRFDASAGTAAVYLNGNMNTQSVGPVSGAALTSFSVRGMQRMTLGSYLDFYEYAVCFVDGVSTEHMEDAECYSDTLFQTSYSGEAQAVTVTQTGSVPLNNGACNTGLYLAFQKSITRQVSSRTYEGVQGQYHIDLVYDVDIEYPSSVDGVNIVEPYYRLDIAGFGHLRIYQNRVHVLNSNSAADHTMSVLQLHTNKQTGNRLRITLDTAAETFTVALNSESNVSTGAAQNSPVAAIKSMQLYGMERMGTGSYLKLTGYHLHCLEDLNRVVTNSDIYEPTEDPVFYYTQPRDENGNYDYFGYVMYDDPQDLSDEAFFGVWDADTSAWTMAPYFRYDAYPAMAAVENAAKQGDYAAAKTALLAYYRSAEASRVTPAGSLPDKAALYLDALARNVYATGFLSGDLIDIFEVGVNQGWSKYTIDVKDTLTKAKGSYQIFSNMISSVDKYYTTAEIYSREAGEYAPKLLVTAKDKSGTVRTLEISCCKDGMIAAGTQGDTNYGSAQVMQVEEHGTYQHYDAATKRVFLGFDISGLSSSDTIVSASVELYARSYIANDETRVVSTPKELSYYWYQDGSWAENTLCWNSFSDQLWFSCNDMEAWDYVTSNQPSVKGKVCGYHRDSELSKLANAYSYYHKANNDAEAEKYAYTYLRQEMALINALGLNTNVMNALDLSTHLAGTTSDVLRVIDSEHMTGEILTAIMKFQWQIAEHLATNYYGTASNNGATFATCGVYATYARFPEYARYDAWKAATAGEYNRVCFDNDDYGGELVFADGLCVELSHNYISTLLSTFYSPISIKNATGEPLPYSQAVLDMLQEMLDTWVLSCGPYFGGFNLGDGYDPYTAYKSTFSNWYNNVFSDDEILQYAATNGASGALPENPTVNFPSGLRTYMRSGWDTNSLQMSFTGKMVGSHGHKDALSVAMFAYGKYLLTDPGYGSVLTGSTANLMLSPDYHNLVTVNDGAFSTMAKVDSTQLDFQSNLQYDFVEYASTASTTASLMQRSVTFAKNQKFWIVTDYDVPNDTADTNDFYQHWHVYPGANPTFDAATKIFRTNFSNQPNVQVVPVGADALTAYTEDTLYSEKAGQRSNAKQGIYKLSKTGNGIFTTIIVPEDTGENVAVSATKLSTGRTDEVENACTFTITKDGETSRYYFYHINNAAAKTGVTLGSYATDATTLLVQEDMAGQVLSVYAVDATYLNKGNTAIFSNTTNIDDLSIRYVNDTVEVYSDSAGGVDTLYTDGYYRIVWNGAATDLAPEAALLDYSLYSDLADIPGLTYTASTVTDVVELADGTLRRRQTSTIPLDESGSRNTATNAPVRQYLYAVLEEDTANGTVLEADALQGVYRMDLTYSADAQQYDSSYYTLSCGTTKQAGLYGRIYPASMTLLNSSSLVNNTLAPSSVAAAHLDGAQHVLHILFDTVQGTVSVQIDDGGLVSGPYAPPAVGMLTLTSMQRTPVDAWMGLDSIRILQYEAAYSDEALAVLGQLPEKLAADIGNVTADLTLPQISGVTWSSSNEAVISAASGAVTLPDTACDVTLTASFTVTLPDASTVTYKKHYTMLVPAAAL